MPDTATTAPEAMAVAFARVLRGAGLAVPVSSVVSFAEALAVVGIDHRDDVYWSARATLVRRPEDHELFDRAFQVFWEHAGPGADAEPEPEPMTITLAVDSGDEQDGDEQDAAPPSDDPSIELRFSTTEVLKHKDFAAYDDVELAEAHRLMTRMRVVGSPRRSLRMRPTSRHTVATGPAAHGPRRAAHRGRADHPPLPPSRRRATGGSSCCSTSAGRWSRTPGHCCGSCRPPWPDAAASRRSRSARA